MNPEGGERPARRLGERLIGRNLLTEAQLQVGLKEQRRTGEPLGSILVSLGFVQEEDLARLLVEDVGVEFVSLREVRPERDLIEPFELDFLRSRLFLPLRRGPQGVEVVMANPSDIYAADAIQQALQEPVVVKGATQTEVLDAIAKEAHLRRREGEDEEDPSDEAAVDAVESMILRAIELGATDLHIEPEEKLVRVRYRVDGVLEPGENFPVALCRAIVTRIKILSGMDITENRAPQDGRLAWDGPYGRVDIRVSVLPCVQGETIVCRLLDHSGNVTRPERLGLPRSLAQRLRELVRRPHGVFYVTGPTGSGKSTTLYALLATLDPMERKICTVEDPVEYRLPLIRQCQVDADSGRDFGSALRALLRQDPDVILLGETRDLETAQITIRAALTGHLVMSTLHTTTALGAVARLRDMGVEPFLISSSLSGVLGQRLLRKLCKACRVETPVPALHGRLFTDAGLPIPERTFEPRGCEACSERGYQGRQGIFEFLDVNERLREAIARNAPSPELSEIAHRAGYRTMFESALQLIVDGETSLSEVLRVIPEASGDSAEVSSETVAPVALS